VSAFHASGRELGEDNKWTLAARADSMGVVESAALALLSDRDFEVSLLTSSLAFFASHLKLKTPLSDMSRPATEGTDWFQFLGLARGCRSSGSSGSGSYRGGSCSSNSSFMCLLILKHILNLLHCQIRLCRQHRVAEVLYHSFSLIDYC